MADLGSNLKISSVFQKNIYDEAPGTKFEYSPFKFLTITFGDKK